MKSVTGRCCWDIKPNTQRVGDKYRHTLTHTYLHTCLNSSPFPSQASLVSTLWSCRLLVFWCKLSGGRPSEEQRAWQLGGWWVLSNTAPWLIFFYPLLSLAMCPSTHPLNRRMLSPALTWLIRTLNVGVTELLESSFASYIFATYLSDKQENLLVVNSTLGWCFGGERKVMFELSFCNGIFKILNSHICWKK